MLQSTPDRLRLSSLALAVALFSAIGAPAANAAPADETYALSPSERVLALSSGPPEPSASALLEAAILFSGAEPERAEAATAIGSRAVAAALALSISVPDEYERGARVLELEHSILSRYELMESRLDRALIDGRYNCVGSSTLYAVLARAAGLAVRGVVLDEHAYCYIVVGGRRVDVETTVPGGYGGAADPRSSGPSRDASARGLVALALRNRATLLERSGRWADALALSADAYAYDPGELTLQTLTGRVNNCVAALLRAGRYGDALALADSAIAAYGESPAFAELRDVSRLAALTESLRVAGPSEALAIAEGAQAAKAADARWLERAFSYAYAGLAEERRKAGDHLGSWRVAEEGAARVSGSAALAALERTARSNWVKASHNAFAALYNAGAYAEALTTIRAALALAPGERILQDDERAAISASSAASEDVRP